MRKQRTTHPKDEFYLKRVLSLAERGRGKTAPNPLVGALIVKKGRIVSEGFHQKLGLPHAEVMALRRAGDRAKGGTLYVNLEPCCHVGRTPPCTEAILPSGIREVVIGMKDPNPLNSGRGIRILRSHGIRVNVGVLKKECEELNAPFIKTMTRHLPYVTVKVAQSLDGKIATFTGASHWITGETTRRLVHAERAHSDAILVGVNTVLKDDPLLTARQYGKPLLYQPTRIILDRYLRTPRNSRLIQSSFSAPLILAIGKDVPEKRLLSYHPYPIVFLRMETEGGKVKLSPLLKTLAEMEITHLLVEGGGTVIADFFEHRLVDRILWFIAPKLIGGKEAPTSFEGKGFPKLSQAISFKKVKVRKVGEDLLIEGTLH
ncbi:MAG: bifunctional diaminohydroxyphosphoribosylaminopyrimidine deaminase/5-amino-6-(5-phosphoribosylamino)uracil reductase RibD [Candidatus Omnitrophica bacterium]|nr:bifunctional diaminohydroxyphosphoribosylaminopyrimidine deaminase/5-amino-6-(5-phosphoribosylamino)uracil reductase RibD [Candidatus Omnitrophota bacterium]